LYHKHPTYSHLRSFGCLCFPTTLKTHKDKFEPRATPHIFVGYPFNTKGYKVLDLATKRIHVSRDVIFHESIFPFVIAHVGSNFASVLNLIVNHSTNLTSMPSTINIFDTDDLLDTNTSHQVTDNQVTINTAAPNITTAPSIPAPISSCDAPHAPRRTTRSLHTPTYLKDYNYTLPNLHSSTSVVSNSHPHHFLTSFVTTHDSICFTSFCLDSQQLVENISHDREPCSYKEAILSLPSKRQ